MKSYIQLTKIAETYYDIWTSDGIDTFHADADEIAAWLKREDLRTAEDAELDDLTEDEIGTVADMIADMVKIASELDGKERQIKRWYFIEDCTSSRSEIYDTVLTADTATEAFVAAARKWEALTDNDRAARDEAYIGYADTDEDGCMDYDTMTQIYYLKRNGETAYYILDDTDGYGSSYPYCSDPVETANLLEGWTYSDTEDPLPDCWHTASSAEIREFGTYDAITGESHEKDLTPFEIYTGDELIPGKRYVFLNGDICDSFVFDSYDGNEALFEEFVHDQTDGHEESRGEIRFDIYQVSRLIGRSEEASDEA